MNHYVYEITNNINGMKYIGKRSCHCEIEKDNYMGSGKVLKKVKEEFGQKNFSKRILAVADDAEMALDLESYYIERRDAVDSPLYYNQVYGGDISHMFKHKDIGKQERVRKMIAEKNKGTNAGENSKVARKVICLNNKKIYVSMTEAGAAIGKTKSAISRACNKKTLVGETGIDINTGNKLRWMYYDEYLQRIEDDNPENIEIVNSFREKGIQVICLNTKEKFNSILEAYNKYGAKNIAESCIFGTTSGVHPDTKEELRWQYWKARK